MSDEKQVIYLIVDKYGRYISDHICGSSVWKDHISRAAIYQTPNAAQKDITFFGIDGKVVEISKWW